MKKRSAINLAVVIILTAAFGALAIFGLNIGALEIKPLVSGISQGLDLRGGVSAVYLAVDEGQEDYASLLSGTMAVLRSRLTGQGFTEATVTQQGTDRIRVEIPDVDDPNEILNIIGQPAKLEFKTPDGEVIMDGSAVKKAEMGYLEGQPVVQFELNDEGTDAFAKATAANIGKVISIELDGNVISAPTVNTAITGGSGYIEGNFTAEYCAEPGDADSVRRAAAEHRTARGSHDFRDAGRGCAEHLHDRCHHRRIAGHPLYDHHVPPARRGGVFGAADLHPDRPVPAGRHSRRAADAARYCRYCAVHRHGCGRQCHHL